MASSLVTSSCVCIVLVQLAAIPAKGADAAAPDPGPDAMRAARAFLRTVGKSDDKVAYELTAPAYREAKTAEQFAEQMVALREATALTPVPPLKGWVLVKPAEDETRRALFASSALRVRRGRAASPGALGIELTEHDGRWLVAGVRPLVPAKVEGHFEFMPGREVNDFGAPLRKLAKRDGPARMVSSGIRGVLTDVKADSVTIEPARPEGQVKNDGNAAPAPLTFTIGDDMPVTVEVHSEFKMPDGRVQNQRGIAPGSLADLKAGAEVEIEPGDEDDHAVEIHVKRRADAAEGL